MKQEDKDLLLQDLCARLPYGVKCKLIYKSPIKDEDATLYGIDRHGTFLFAEFGEDTRKFVCKPYLFPLSSMTEEQYKEYTDMGYSVTERWWSMANYHQIEWFNKNHFDYRGLIPMGLAIDCTNLNIY